MTAILADVAPFWPQLAALVGAGLAVCGLCAAAEHADNCKWEGDQR